MKNLCKIFLCLIGLNIGITNCYSQTQIDANAIVASSDFVQASVLIDADPSNYAYISASLGVLSTSSLTATFPQNGHAGDIITLNVQGNGGLLSASLLNNITIKVYDANNVNVATGTGGTTLNLGLSLSGPNIYSIRYLTDATASYTIKKVTIEINNLLSVQLLDQFRIYKIYLQSPCPPVYATSVSAAGGILSGHVDNSAFAVSSSTSDVATLEVPLLGSAYLDLAFATNGIAGEYVGFTVGQSSTVLSLNVLQSIIVEAYNSSGGLVASKNNFAVADLRLLDGSTNKYYLGFVTPAGAYNIAKLKITLGGISVLNSLNVYNAMHFKLSPNAISVQGSPTFCSGSSITLTANSSTLSNLLWNNGSTISPITITQSGTYSASTTDDQGCVSNSAPISVTALALPTVSIPNGSTAGFCQGSDVKLSANTSLGNTLLWSNGATTNDITVNATNTYTVVATDANLCKSAIASITVSSLPLPTVSMTNGSTTGFCQGSDVKLSASTPVGNTLLWSNGATTNDITVNAANTYTVVATDANLCKSVIASITVSSLPLPTVSITNGPTTSFCQGSDVKLSASTLVGNTLLWSNGATTNDITVNTANTYTVVATNANLCKSVAASVTVSSLPLPTVSITNGSTTGFCQGSNVKLSASTPVGNTLLWSNGATTNDITVNTANTYSVVATDANLCKSVAASVTVSSLPLPTVSINNGSTASFCAGSNVQLSATPSIGSSLLWSNGATTNDITVNTAGIYTVTATGTNLCKSVIASINVSSLPIPTVNITNGPTTSFCAGANIKLIASASSGSSLLWSNGATTNDITVNTSGTFTVVATGVNLCKSTIASITVNSLSLPNVSINNGSTDGFCVGSDVTLSTNASSGSSLLWSNGATTSDITVNTAGTYTVTATGANLCKSIVASITVSSFTIPTVSITNSGSNEFCDGNNVTLTAISPTAINYSWNTSENQDHIIVSSSGDYSVTVTDVNDCSATSSDLTISVKNNPVVDSVIQHISCFGNNNGRIELDAQNPLRSYSYTWNTTSTDAAIENLSPGLYTVTVKDNASLCTIDIGYTIHQPAELIVQGSTSKETCVGNDGEIKLNVSGGTLPYSYNHSAIQNNILASIGAGVYQVTVTDKNMCTSSQSLTVLKADCNISLNIHDVITPNNDGLNDVMIIEGIDNYPNCSLEIFDKWGDKVYNKDQYDNTWSGRNKNDSGPLPSGTYYYLLKLNANEVPDGKSDYTGFVMIQ